VYLRGLLLKGGRRKREGKQNEERGQLFPKYFGLEPPLAHIPTVITKLNAGIPFSV